MPSLKNDGGELWKYLDTVYKYTVFPAGLSTTATEAITEDMPNTDAASIGSLAGGEHIGIIGTGGAELAVAASAATGNIVWGWPLQVAQESGAAIVQMARRSMNHIAEGGVQVGGVGGINARRASTARVAIAFTPTAIEGFTYAIPTLGFNSPNLASAFGQPEAENGVGTAADPYAIAITRAKVMTEGRTFFRLMGTLDNGDIIALDLCDCRAEPNVAMTLGVENTEGPVSAGRCTTLLQRIWTP